MAKSLKSASARGLAAPRPSGLKKTPAKQSGGKKAAKHAAKKVVEKGEKKRKGEKGDRKQPRQRQKEDGVLIRAYHHLQRAAVVISLIEPESGGDLKGLLDYGLELYRQAQDGQGKGAKATAHAALGVSRGAEHLCMAAFYSARDGHRLTIAAPEMGSQEEATEELFRKLEKSSPPRGAPEELKALATELLRRSEAAGDDPQLSWELLMSAEGLWSALEESKP